MAKLRRGCKRGFTLVELMVACFLLGGLVAVAGYMIYSGLQAQVFERSVRNAQTVIRTTMDRMADDMRLASNVTSSTTYAGYSFNFGGRVYTSPSGVLVPSSYGEGLQGDETFIATRTADEGKGDKQSQKVSFTVDRTAFTRLRDDQEHYKSATLSSAASIDNFVYVIWEVPAERPFEITRKVYRTEGNIGWDKSALRDDFEDERGLTVEAPWWTFSIDNMTTQRGGSLAYGGGNGVLNAEDFIAGSLLPEEVAKNVEAGKVEGKESRGRGGDFVATNATMHFVVSHPAYRGHSSGGGSFNLGDSIEPVYYTAFDRGLFRIDFYALVHKDGDRSGYPDLDNQRSRNSLIAQKFLTGKYPDSLTKARVTQLEISTQVRVQNRD